MEIPSLVIKRSEERIGRMQKKNGVAVLIAVLLLVAATAGGCRELTPLPEPTHIRRQPANENSVHLLLGGDTMLDDLALPYLLKHGWDYQLAGLKPFFERMDLVGLNLEVPVCDECRRAKAKKYSYSMTPASLAGLKENGVDLVCLANNHFRDCGDYGKETTIKHLDEWRILHYGGGLTEQDANRPVIVSFGETRIGFLGFYNDSRRFSVHGTARMSEDNIRGLVGELRPLVDVLVVSFHWGKNYRVEIDATQRRFGRLAIDHGADAVVGHGPHILQAMEMYRGKPVIYSLGNCAFGTGNNLAREGLLAELVIRDRRLAEVLFHPLNNQNRSEDVKWQPRIAQGALGRKTLRNFIGASRQLGADLNLQKNQAVLTLAE